MANYNVNSNGAGQAVRYLESASFTNLVPGTALTVTKAFSVPNWAVTANVVLTTLVFSGTSPLLDFTLLGSYDLDTTHGYALGGWDGITQLTAHTAPITQSIEIGPNITIDDTGSATASSNYGVQASLPPWLVYTYVLDATTNDEDYGFDIRCKFSRGR